MSEANLYETAKPIATANATYPMVPLSEVIDHRKEFIAIDDLESYKRCRVQLHAQGIVLRDVIKGAEIKTKKQQVCRSGEFLVAEIDAKIGGFGIVPDDLDGAVVSSHYFLFQVKEGRLDKRFLDFFIRTPAFRDQVTAQGSTNYAAIRPYEVLSYQIPLPPIAEQRRIVARVEELAGKVEEARGLRSQTIKEVETLWQSNLVSVFSKIAIDCQSETFGKICDVVRGGSPRPAGNPLYYGGSIPFLKVGDLTRDETKYVSNYTETIKEAGLYKSRYIEPNTLMLTNSGATLGVPKICPFGTCFNDGIQAFLNIPNDIFPEYLYYFFLSKTQWFREWAARGQGQPNLNTEMVKKMEFPYPPLPEQRRIVAYLDDLQAKIDALKRLQAETGKELNALLPSILDKAFKGEL